LCAVTTGAGELDVRTLQQWRDALLKTEPEIYHDVTEWRWRALESGMRQLGLTAQEAKAGADAAMNNFAHWRSRVDVPQETHDTLQSWAKVAAGGDYQR
jgi:putative hydrolase of the HAD superfamily